MTVGCKLQGLNPHWTNGWDLTRWIHLTHRPEYQYDLENEVKKKISQFPFIRQSSKQVLNKKLKYRFLTNTSVDIPFILNSDDNSVKKIIIDLIYLL